MPELTTPSPEDEFIAVIAHELRTPLNALLGWVKLLRSGRLDDKTFARGLEAVENSARAQAQIIEKLLDFSRLMSGARRFRRALVTPAAVIRAALVAAQPAADAKQITLREHLDDNAGPVMADAARLRQVFANLLDNALKFTPDGGRVDISLTAGAEQVTIVVSDTGPGLAPELLPHLFTRHRPAGPTPAKHGLGLGLPSACYIVEAHGGALTAAQTDSPPGAAFTITLPRAVPQDQGSKQK